jgi:hypothetical protein
MQVLKNIKSEHIIAIDIETVRVKENFTELDPGTQSAFEYKNKQDGQIPESEELMDMWERTSSLYAEFSKVCAVSIAFLHEGKLYCKEFYGEDEVEILNQLSTSLNNMSLKSKKEGVVYRLVGHAAKFFDYPFLAKRYIINGMNIPEILDVTDKKPWESSNLCTNELWKVGGTGAGSSLQALCNVLQIPVSKVDLVGDEVGKAFYRGEFERISRYCSYDTVATFNVIRKFKQESVFEFDNVIYTQAIKPQEQPRELTPVEKVVYTKDVKAAEEIKEKVKKSKTKDKKAEEKVLKFLDETL